MVYIRKTIWVNIYIHTVQTKQEVSKKFVVLESMCVGGCACVGGGEYSPIASWTNIGLKLTVIIDTVVDSSITKNGL